MGIHKPPGLGQLWPKEFLSAIKAAQNDAGNFDSRVNNLDMAALYCHMVARELKKGERAVSKKFKFKNKKKHRRIVREMKQEDEKDLKMVEFEQSDNCHDNPLELFNIGKHIVRLAGIEDAFMRDIPPPVVVIDTCGWFRSPIRVEGLGFGRFQKVASPIVVRFDWPLGSLPCLGSRAWAALAKDIEKLPGSGEVMIACDSGHGRGATVAALLAHFSGVSGDEHPVYWARRELCRDAMKNATLCEYISDMTNMDLKKPEELEDYEEAEVPKVVSTEPVSLLEDHSEKNMELIRPPDYLQNYTDYDMMC